MLFTLLTAVMLVATSCGGSDKSKETLIGKYELKLGSIKNASDEYAEAIFDNEGKFQIININEHDKNDISISKKAILKSGNS